MITLSLFDYGTFIELFRYLTEMLAALFINVLNSFFTTPAGLVLFGIIAFGILELVLYYVIRLVHNN